MDLKCLGAISAITITRKNVNNFNDTLLPLIPSNSIYLPKNRFKAVVKDVYVFSKIEVVLPTPFGPVSQYVSCRWIFSAGEFKKRFDKVQVPGGKPGHYRIILKTDLD